MPELIDRHALLKKVYEHPQERERMTDGEWCRKCIYEAPKVESEPVRQPVRHGRWVYLKWINSVSTVEFTPAFIFECSECLSEIAVKNCESHLPKYCSECGSDMREPTDIRLDKADDVMMG